MKNSILIDPRDTVAVALVDLEPGTKVSEGISTTEKIPAKHKVALQEFQQGDRIHMYGVTVGVAETVISAGGLITTKNLKHETDTYSAAGRADTPTWHPHDISRWSGRTFNGYHRSDGRVGTQNVWLVIPLVFCENRNINVMREAISETLGMGQRSRYEGLFKRMAY